MDALSAVRKIGDAELLWHQESDLSEIDAVIIPGGFSYGDYLRVGAVARFSPIMSAVSGFASNGGPVLGICNGFQVLCEAGLLPGALLPNIGLKFLCRFVEIEVVNGETAWTRHLPHGTTLSIPAKHNTGRYYAPEQLLDELKATGQIVFRYSENPNGSVRDIAGVSNREGNVVGLMPHPEHAIDELLGSADGLKLFQSVTAKA
jgi:phosphoribosylformylglycinamidine synthase